MFPSICLKLFYYLFLGVFNGPDIKKMLKSQKFFTLLSPFEREAFQSIKDVVNNFLGNHRAENYQEIIQTMMTNFHRLKINMSPKIHYIHQHLDFFRDHLGKISDEHGERFHQEIKAIEHRFQGKKDQNMLAEYVWNAFEEDEEERRVFAYRIERARSSISLRSDRLSLLNLTG